jgi:hypothetical protein
MDECYSLFTCDLENSIIFSSQEISIHNVVSHEVSK